MNLPPVCLSVIRPGLTALVCLSFSACTVLPPSLNILPPMSVAREPVEFRFSKEEIRRAYRSQRQIGVVDLSAAKIREQKSTGQTPGTEYLATGGALLVKRYSPPIFAKADEIRVTPDFAEVRGLSVVRKDDRLYIGETAESRIIIEAATLRTVGLVSVKSIGTAAEVAEAMPAPTLVPPPPTPAVVEAPPPMAPAINVPEEREVIPEAPKPAPKKRVVKKTKPKAAATPKPKSEPAEAPPVVETPKPKAEQPPVPKPAPEPAAKPAIDRDKLLKMMRPPTE